MNPKNEASTPTPDREKSETETDADKKKRNQRREDIHVYITMAPWDVDTDHPYSEAYKTGRLAIHTMNTQNGIIMVANIYGWTGGSEHQEAAVRTHGLIQVAVDVIAEAGDPPAIIVGDFNADVEALHLAVREDIHLE